MTLTMAPRATVQGSSTELVGIGWPGSSARRAMRPTRTWRPSMNMATPSTVGAKARSAIMPSRTSSPARIVHAGTGSRFSSAAAIRAEARTRSMAANPRTINPILFNMDTPELAHALRDCLGHFIRGLDDLGIHFVGALGGDQLGDFLDRVDVRGFEILLVDLAVAGIAGQPDDWRAGRRGLAVEIAAQRFEAGLVGEIGEIELADLPRVHFRIQLGKHLSGLVDRDLDRSLRHRDCGIQQVAVGRDELAVGVG